VTVGGRSRRAASEHLLHRVHARPCQIVIVVANAGLASLLSAHLDGGSIAGNLASLDARDRVTASLTFEPGKDVCATRAASGFPVDVMNARVSAGVRAELRWSAVVH